MQWILFVSLASLLAVLQRIWAQRNEQCEAAMDAWCDASSLVLDHAQAHGGGWIRREDAKMRSLIRQEAEAYEEFLRTHPYCQCETSREHVRWYRSIYEWRPPVLPTPKYS